MGLNLIVILGMGCRINRIRKVFRIYDFIELWVVLRFLGVLGYLKVIYNWNVGIVLFIVYFF